MAKVSPLMIAPPLIFAALAAMFWLGMQREDPNALPSAFVGKPAPPVASAGLPGFAPLTDQDLRTGEVTIVNFWASWCPPCRAEHPVLMQMATDGIRVAGANFKDSQADAIEYLGQEGNPFFGISFDPSGRNAVDWGIAAPPETFIVDGDGTVLYKFIGPLVGSHYERTFLPELDAALGRN